jgi:5'-phosphate synthase pdxT subunit
MIVGVLAIQGDFERHLYRLSRLGVEGREIRNVDEFVDIDGLIIPGGESTTLSILIDRFSMREKLQEFCRTHAVWGTCTGLIMLSKSVDDKRVKPLGIIDISVKRNGYGRQIYSFFHEIDADIDGNNVLLPASFIRAPVVVDCNSNINILARFDGSPVLLSQRNCLGSTFHTELDDDLTLTKFFVDNFVLKYIPDDKGKKVTSE